MLSLAKQNAAQAYSSLAGRESGGEFTNNSDASVL